MKYDKLKQKIDGNDDSVSFGDFGNGVSDEWIDKAEKRLSVKFPPSYIWWLKNYSGGEINGDEIFSIYELDFDTVVGGDIVYINELNRKNSIIKDDQLVIQENDQGEIYFFDLQQKDNLGEYPVYLDITNEKYANNFIDFLIKKIEE